MGLWAPNKCLRSGQTNCRTNNTSVPQNPSRITQSSQRVKARQNKVGEKRVASICYQVFLFQRKSVPYRVKTLNLEGEKKVSLYSVPVMRWLSYANAGTQSCMFNGQMLNLSLTVWTDKCLVNGFWGESILPTKTNLNFNDTLKAPKVNFFFHRRGYRSDR